MIRIKICGITKSSDAFEAVRLGAWALGFNFYRKSPRYINPLEAKKIIVRLPPFVTPVGLFVNTPAEIIRRRAAFCGINTVQLHGDEPASQCRSLKPLKVIKAFRLRKGFDFASLERYDVSAFLFDTLNTGGLYGGSGEVFDWNILKRAGSVGRPVILAGGIHSGNLRQAYELLRPYAVDVCSGIETRPGKKDPKRMNTLFRIAREAGIGKSHL